MRRVFTDKTIITKTTVISDKKTFSNTESMSNFLKNIVAESVIEYSV